jgi:hypothetical protein
MLSASQKGTFLGLVGGLAAPGARRRKSVFRKKPDVFYNATQFLVCRKAKLCDDGHIAFAQESLLYRSWGGTPSCARGRGLSEWGTHR